MSTDPLTPLDRLTIKSEQLYVHSLAICALVTAGESEIALKMSYLEHELAEQVVDLVREAGLATPHAHRPLPHPGGE